MVIVRVRKNALRRSEVFKKSSKASSKPKAPELERLAPNLTKARETEKLFEMNITLEGKEIFSSFERKSSLESLAQNIPEWPSQSHAHNLSFTHDGYLFIYLFISLLHRTSQRKAIIKGEGELDV